MGDKNRLWSKIEIYFSKDKFACHVVDMILNKVEVNNNYAILKSLIVGEKLCFAYGFQ